MATLYALLKLGDHVVAQVVESELIVCAVGHVGGVCLTSGDGAQFGGLLVAAVIFGIEQVRTIVRDHANGEPHKGEDRTHPARVATGEVVVDGHHVYAAATNSVNGGTERPYERLSFTRAHLRDLSLMQHDGAKNLLVVRAHTSGAARCFTRSRENLRQLFVERRFERITFERAQHGRDRVNACTNLVVGCRLHLVGARVDGVENWLESTELAVVRIYKSGEEAKDHRWRRPSARIRRSIRSPGCRR